jgi:GT2 family glycosyltransferase
MKPSPKNKPPILSVIILDYNALPYLVKLYESICKSVLTSQIEVILVDNASADDSLNIIKKTNYRHPKINFRYLQNGGNIGFAAGNNRAVAISDHTSKYVLFLNPDTSVEPNTFQGMIDYLEANPHIDTATCHVTLTLTGQLQPECHRGFPTPWNSFCHFFLPFLSKIFPKVALFNGYLLGHLDYSKVQQIDCCVGAFYMLKREVGEKVGWWNEKYFMYGEDLDFCYKVKKAGHNLYFIPFYKINHYQGISSGIKKAKSAASRETKVRSAKATTNAMRIFYQENLLNSYPSALRPLVNLGISFLESYRVFRARYL